jgi:hypothetical protein
MVREALVEGNTGAGAATETAAGAGPGTETFRAGSNPTIRETLGMTVLPRRSEAGFSSGGATCFGATAVALVAPLPFLKKSTNGSFI